MAESGLGKDGLEVLAPTAVRIVARVFDQPHLDWFAMDECEYGGELVDGIYGLRTETVLEEVPAALILAVEVVDVSVSNTFQRLPDFFLTFADEQMEMVRHEAVGIVRAVLSGGHPLVIVTDAKSFHTGHEVLIIFRVLEDQLMVDSAHHHMIDAGRGSMSWCSWHGAIFQV